MKKQQTLFSLIIALNLFVVLIIIPALIAQEDQTSQCETLALNALTTTANKCGTQPLNSVCIGNSPARVTLDGGEIEFLPGDTLALDMVRTLTTGAANTVDAKWGIARLQIDTGLAAGGVDLILFGEAAITNAVTTPTLDLPTLMLTNTAGYDVNLRAGPGTNTPTIGLLPNGTQVAADGRSTNGEWYRVRSNAGIAWVHQTLVRVEGDAAGLTTLESPYTSPLQAFVLTSTPTDKALCGVSASGLLVHYTGDAETHLMANGVDMAFGRSTLLLQASADTGLLVHVLAGDVIATAADTAVSANEGASLRVPLAADSLLASSVPQLEERYPFAAVAGAPVELMSAAEMQCVAGVGVGETANTTFAGPGEAYAPQAVLNAVAHYSVTGYAPDEAQNIWYKLDNGTWIPRNQVRTVGLCGALTQVSAPPLNPVTPLPGQSFLPSAQTIYFAESGSDVMTGQCSSSPLAICSHPAAITPNGDGTFMWRGQEPIDYRMSPTGENSYFYSGRNFSDNANLSLALTMTSPTTWNLTMTTVFDNDALCQHTYNYTATLR